MKVICIEEVEESTNFSAFGPSKVKLGEYYNVLDFEMIEVVSIKDKKVYKELWYEIAEDEGRWYRSTLFARTSWVDETKFRRFKK